MFPYYPTANTYLVTWQTIFRSPLISQSLFNIVKLFSPHEYVWTICRCTFCYYPTVHAFLVEGKISHIPPSVLVYLLYIFQLFILMKMCEIIVAAPFVCTIATIKMTSLPYCPHPSSCRQKLPYFSPNVCIFIIYFWTYSPHEYLPLHDIQSMISIYYSLKDLTLILAESSTKQLIPK